MSNKHIAILVAALVVSVVGGLALHAYIDNRMNVARFEQVKQDVDAANKKADAVATQAAQDRAAAEKRDADRQQQLTLTLTAIAAQKQQPVTADQLAAMIMARIPQVQVTGNQLDKLPNAPSAEKSVRDYLLDCDSCKAERDSLKQAVANRDSEMTAVQTEKAQLETEKKGLVEERDAAIKAAKGGSVLHRVGKAAKVIGCAAGGAALGSLSHGASGAAVGSAAGATFCSIW